MLSKFFFSGSVKAKVFLEKLSYCATPSLGQQPIILAEVGAAEVFGGIQADSEIGEKVQPFVEKRPTLPPIHSPRPSKQYD